uniref:Large ribosomal subunit protein uL10 n=1 Tax=Podarcis muralis TaxID=64176 RepID=A0A670HMJ2_PODMU
MPREDRATWKSNYFLKIIQLLDDYPKCFIVGADNVGSKQMQQIHMSLRGKAVVLMGKNTMMPLEKLLPHICGNVGFVFPKEDLTEIRDMLLANKVPAAAGAIAPCEVTVPAQNTGLGPEKTSFFQALGITTKISRGTIEILSDVQWWMLLYGKESEREREQVLSLLQKSNVQPLLIDGVCVERVTTFRFLGIELQEDLSWSVNTRGLVKEGAAETVLFENTKEKPSSTETAACLLSLCH